MTKSFTLRDLLILVFYNQKAISIAIAIPILLGILAAVTTKTQYTADGLLMVLANQEQAGSSALSASNAVISVDNIKLIDSELQILKSNEVVGHVIDQIGIRTLFPSLAGRRVFGLLPPLGHDAAEREAIDRFDRQLRAEVQSDSNVFRISFTHPNRTVAIQVVKDLIQAYLVQRRAVFDNPTSPFLASEVARISGQLQALDDQIDKVRTEYHVIDISQDIILAANQQDSILQRKRQVEERRQAIIAEVANAETEIRQQSSEVFDFQEKTNQTQNNDDHNTLLRLELERAHLKTQYALDYPPLQEVNRKIKIILESMADHRPLFTTTRRVRNPALDFLNQRLLTVRIEAQALNQQIAELARQDVIAGQRVDQLRKAESILHDLIRTRDLTEQLYREFSLREAQARMAEDAEEARQANVRVVQWAHAQGEGSSMALSYLLAGIFGGLLLGAAVGMVATWMRQVYIMPSEATRALGLPVLAEFSEAPDEFQNRQSRQELAQVASSMLDMLVDGEPLSIFQIVAVNHGDVEAPLVAALATEFAEGRKLKTLVIDLDGSGRTVFEQLGRPKTEPTVDSVRQGDFTIMPTAVPLLSVTVNAPQSELGSLRTPLKASAARLAQLREAFDVVVLNAPSPLSSHVTRRLSSLVDANLVVIRSELTRAPAATQLCELLLGAGGDLLGVVFTKRRFYIPRAIYQWL